MSEKPSVDRFNALSTLNQYLIRLIIAFIGATILLIFVIVSINLVFFVLDSLELIRGRYRFFVPSRSLFTFLIGFAVFWIKAPDAFNSFFYKLSESFYLRLFSYSALFYVISLLSFIQTFEPGEFRSGLEFLVQPSRYGNDFEEFLKLLVYPIFIGGLGIYFYSKSVVRNPSDGED